MDKQIILLIIGIVAAWLLGYFIGKTRNSSLKPLGQIVFEPYVDQEDQEERVMCTFKLGLDVSEIIKQDYILFEVHKTQKALDYYSQNLQGH